MPKYNNPRNTSRYTDELKIRAVDTSHQKGKRISSGNGLRYAFRCLLPDTERTVKAREIFYSQRFLV